MNLNDDSLALNPEYLGLQNHQYNETLKSLTENIAKRRLPPDNVSELAPQPKKYKRAQSIRVRCVTKLKKKKKEIHIKKKKDFTEKTEKHEQDHNAKGTQKEKWQDPLAQNKENGPLNVEVIDLSNDEHFLERDTYVHQHIQVSTVGNREESPQQQQGSNKASYSIELFEAKEGCKATEDQSLYGKWISLPDLLQCVLSSDTSNVSTHLFVQREKQVISNLDALLFKCAITQRREKYLITYKKKHFISEEGFCFVIGHLYYVVRKSSASCVDWYFNRFQYRHQIFGGTLIKPEDPAAHITCFECGMDDNPSRFAIYCDCNVSSHISFVVVFFNEEEINKYNERKRERERENKKF
ncbi:hypothetical protein RFI_24564 [Reticulomyxa filosa]|uniref:Uncharacterized protein n=1 Tax=Reticulomyxa filosa TaxID=46433 RepID=X6MFY7_RETFI|nr:hypothetical protein RFI_24564 [Reticulomyxa filosa]|eukprot:ETO12809.1 hypothetical protein RFI_24564 [Reticulomyxa filosa]